MINSYTFLVVMACCPGHVTWTLLYTKQQLGESLPFHNLQPQVVTLLGLGNVDERTHCMFFLMKLCCG